jgi:hypothetical protein
MSANLDDAIKKLNDQNVQKRLRSAMRAATIRALAEEGIKLTPEQWGELTARLIAAKDTPETASFWDDILKNLPPVVGPIIGALSDSRLKTNIVHRETLTNGLRICEFSYAGFSNRWKGVIAQDVLPICPDAVFEDETGYLGVDYRRLRVSLQAA